MPTKLLVLGIDAASPDLLTDWAAAGKLPAIRALFERGASGSVCGVDGFYIGSTWPSFYTGLNPARHGFYRIDQLKCGSYDFFRPLDSAEGVGGTPFWKAASDAGRRVAVLDVPLSRLDPDLNGVQIVEWGSHDAVFGFQASSAEVARGVTSTVGAYPLPTDCDGCRRTAADVEEFITGLEAAIGKKTTLTLELLGTEPWDLFVQVFTETHCAGHQCWHLHDATHPAHDAQLRAAVGDPLERVYRAVDRAVGAICERAPDADILLVSAHGMGAYRGAQFLLPEILFRLGATVRPPVRPEGSRRPRNPLTATAKLGWRMLPDAARRALRPLRETLRSRNDPAAVRARLGADVVNSKCFPIPNGSPIGGIRLNLAGREPQGVLQRGADAEAFCDTLIDDLRAIVDTRTARPLIKAVHRTDNLYSGPRRDALPDLLVEWDAQTALGSVELADGRGATVTAASDKIGSVQGSNRYGRTGEHLPKGMFIAAGPGVSASGTGQCMSIMDFHPTICRLMGLPSSDVDGTAARWLVGASR